jgi:hypothetical protein
VHFQIFNRQGFLWDTMANVTTYNEGTGLSDAQAFSLYMSFATSLVAAVLSFLQLLMDGHCNLQICGRCVKMEHTDSDTLDNQARAQVDMARARSDEENASKRVSAMSEIMEIEMQ